MERIQKVIANSGFCSRRQAEKYLAEGVVYVNGEKVTEPGYKVKETDEIKVNKTWIKKEQEKKYFLLYKPEKVISSVKDEKHRKTVVDLIPTKERIYPVGRLDYDTSGLLLLTNDGEFANLLMHPKNQIEKIYEAKINGILNPKEWMMLKKGINIEERKVIPTTLKEKQKNTENNTETIVIGITEGRNHIIKKIFASFGYKVLKLKRIQYAFLTLEGLQKGNYRSLTPKEIKRLYNYK